MTPEIGAKAYLNKLQKQTECYEEIIEISHTQYKLVTEGAFEKLPATVKEREKILRRLDIIQYVTKAYGEYWTKVAYDVDIELNENIIAALDRLHDVLQMLAAYDKKLKTNSTQELERIKNELAIIKRNKVKTKAFRKPIFTPKPVFINRVSSAI